MTVMSQAFSKVGLVSQQNIQKCYIYRSLPCNIQPDYDLWCVVGIDTLDGSGGVLEWCYSREDSLTVLADMQKYPQFTDLKAIKHHDYLDGQYNKAALLDEEPFDIVESSPQPNSFTRYATALLHRSDCRKYWTNGSLLYVMDDFGYLKYVSHKTLSEFMTEQFTKRKNFKRILSE